MTEKEALMMVFEMAEKALDKDSPEYARQSEALVVVDELIAKQPQIDLNPLERLKEEVSQA
jgi:hypothetical protein